MLIVEAAPQRLRTLATKQEPRDLVLRIDRRHGLAGNLGRPRVRAFHIPGESLHEHFRQHGGAGDKREYGKEHKSEAPLQDKPGRARDEHERRVHDDDGDDVPYRGARVLGAEGEPGRDVCAGLASMSNGECLLPHAVGEVLTKSPTVSQRR